MKVNNKKCVFGMRIVNEYKDGERAKNEERRNGMELVNKDEDGE